jgi:hypothetical protein
MAQINREKNKTVSDVRAWTSWIFNFLTRWFFMISILAATIICVFVWYRFIWRAEWSQSKKQQYVSEQAKFSFDKTNYLKTVDMINSRRNKFNNYSPFSGRDVFFPEGQ